MAATGRGLYNENYDYDSQGNLWKKGIPGSEIVYTYLDSNHKHAVTHLGGAPMYSYDPNGNMTTRKVGATTYTQGWDAENRLVTVSGGVSASFSYDGDGVRVKGTVNGTVTAYVGNWFDWTGSTSTMKKYYYAGAQRIAMRTGSGTGTSGLQWIIGDHLDSTTKIANVDGSINSQRRYKPWGEASFGGTMPTTFAFTGQRQEVQLGGTDGLYYYGARWYDAALGRWLSPDSIIPEAAQGVQAWSRYTYVNNAPLNFIDPYGKTAYCAGPNAWSGDCGGDRKEKSFVSPTDNLWISGYDYGDGNGTKSGHLGIDYGDPPTRINASAYGIVRIADACSEVPCDGLVGRNGASVNGGYGNVVVIEYPSPLLPENVQNVLGIGVGQSAYFLYAHLQDGPSFSTGEMVYPGQLLGSVGNSGNSDGSHLHFEVRIGATSAFPSGEMCTNVCYPTAYSGNARFGQWWTLPTKDPNILHPYYSPR